MTKEAEIKCGLVVKKLFSLGCHGRELVWIEWFKTIIKNGIEWLKKQKTIGIEW